MAAFAFGIVANAASASLYIFTKDLGWRSLRDGPRLVLNVFLAGSVLWATVAFIALALDGRSQPGCQVVTSFAFAFDQIARVSLIQFLLWRTVDAGTSTAQRLVLQGIVLIRFLTGGVMVGAQRPQAGAQICLATNIVMPLGITVTAFDIVLSVTLLMKVFVQGSFKTATEGSVAVNRRKTLLLGILGLIVWAGLSTPMMTGMASWALLTRTFLPALGLLLVLGLLALSREYLVLGSQHTGIDEQGRPSVGHTREIGSQDSGYASDQYAPPGRYDEVKGENIVSISAFAQEPRSNLVLNGSQWPQASQGQPNSRTLSAVSRQGTGQNRIGVPAPRNFRKTGGKIQISAPIVVASPNPDANPWQKIATIDLATAARNEQLRRAMPPQPLFSNLVASRPAPRPPVSPETMMKSGAYLRRKELAPITEQSTTSSEPLLDPATMVTTTSAQLSPGADELRRRSPRYSPQVSLSKTSAPSPGPTSARRSQLALSVLTKTEQSKSRPQSTLVLTLPPKSPRRSQYAASTFGAGSSTDSEAPPLPMQDGSVKVVIKTPAKSRNPESPAVPPKDPVVYKAVNGLPRNPRMPMTKPLTQKPQALPQGQTVMLVKSIEYNDPAAVQDILDGATRQDNNKPTLRHTESVVNRPRPIPRQSLIDRQIFPAEGSPSPGSRHGHKRSLSGGSLISRKSILQSVPASPSQLPPLPPVPKTAGNIGRPLPNNTHSMTFNEKMTMFYPDAESASNDLTSDKALRRRSKSVPELPELPVISRERQRSQSRDPLRDSTYHTDKSSRSSMQTASLFDFPEVPLVRTKPVSAARQASIDAKAVKRQSSPVLPREVLPSPSVVSEAKSRDDDTTIWGSIHSPVECARLMKASAVTVPPVPKVVCPAAEKERIEAEAKAKDQSEDAASKQSVTENDDHMLMTIVLDTSTHHSPAARSPATQIERVMQSSPEPPSWHRRVGDEYLTFSGRQNSARRRKMPPPPPLPLTRTIDRRPRLLPAPEPSPLESPQQVLETLQAQLRKFEDPNRDSTGSQQLQRMTLLANLEAEMGLQEGQWKQMHSRLDRDSYSTTTTSPHKRESRRDSLAVSIVEQSDDSQSTRGKVDRKSKRSSFCLRENKRTASVASGRSSRSSGSEHEWDQDLAEAQAEYIKHRYQLVSQLSERSAAPAKVTPASNTIIEKASVKTLSQDTVPRTKLVTADNNPALSSSLWQPLHTPVEKIELASALWSASTPAVTVPDRFAAVTEPGRRSAAKAQGKPLSIESTHLWVKKSRPVSYGPQRGLWDAQPSRRSTLPTALSTPVEMVHVEEQQQSVQTRPTLARRPSRRSKRVTLLPDILENPEPMPDNRGTLALYQFPWGEKSDTASIRPRPQMFMAMPGTMTSGRSSVASNSQPVFNPFEFDPEDYSSSYFDDADEDDGDNFPEAEALSSEDEDYEDDDDSDDFDETTLWEIASLLKSNQVPSRDSLLPLPEGWGFTAEPAQIDYSEPRRLSSIRMADQASGSQDSAFVEDEIAEAETIEEVQTSQRVQALLWDKEVQQKEPRSTASLPHPDEETWEAYTNAMAEPVRAATRSNPTVDGLESTSLWAARAEVQPAKAFSGLWQQAQPVQLAALLWTKKEAVIPPPRGLSNPGHEVWEAYHVKDDNFARLVSRRLPRLTIQSTSLWQAAKPAPGETTQTGLWVKRVPSVPTSHMWTPPTEVAPVVGPGLPQPETSSWNEYKALQPGSVRSKPRTESDEPLPTLASTSLWTSQLPTAGTDSQSWVEPSASRNRSDSNSSIESAVSDASSAKSTATKASTVASIFSNFWKRKRGVSDASSLRSAAGDEIPEVPALPTLPEQRISANTQALTATAAPTTARKDIPIPLRRTYRRTVVYRVDWDAALEEALRASYPSPKLERPSATPIDWSSALQEALSAGQSPAVQTSIPIEAQLWTAEPLKSPHPSTTSLWSHRTAHADHRAFPDASVLPEPGRRARSGSELRAAAAEEVPMLTSPGLTARSLWRRSVAMEKAEVRTRDWLSGTG